jgi:predicted amidophosphoribosyltransferase
MSSTRRSIEEVSDPYANFMLNPVAGAGVCPVCWTFHDPSFDRCYACGHQPCWTDVVVPITYSIDREQMHHSLRHYKDGATPETRARFQLQLAAVLWRFLRSHEGCVAAAAGADAFSVVTVVPSATTARNAQRPRLRQMVGQLVGATADRYDSLLAPTNSQTTGHQYDASRYKALRPLDATSVLLIDDTWTTGASVQSAAYALKSAGARHVGAVVIGRHMRPDWQDTAERVKKLRRPFDWDACAVH